MALNIDATFERNMTSAFKNDMKNLVNFHQSMFISLKIESLIGPFYSKQKMYELKTYKGVMCHGNEK